MGGGGKKRKKVLASPKDHVHHPYYISAQPSEVFYNRRSSSHFSADFNETEMPFAQVKRTSRWTSGAKRRTGIQHKPPRVNGRTMDTRRKRRKKLMRHPFCCGHADHFFSGSYWTSRVRQDDILQWNVSVPQRHGKVSVALAPCYSYFHDALRA